jgi:transcription initiation protein SPT3
MMMCGRKEADELTKGMTREQYHYYADCRQASFTYRKGTSFPPPFSLPLTSFTGKRFREFVNIGAYVEGVTNDEVMDVIGFLCYEMVRALCESGTHTKSTVAAARAVAAINSIKEERAKEVEKARKAKGKGKAMEVEEVVGGQEVSSPAAATTDDKGSNKRSRTGEAVPTPKSPPRRLVDPISLFSEPLNEAPPSGWNTPGGQLVVATGGDQRSVTLPATPGGNTLDVQDVHGGYVGMQRDQSALKASGMRNWRGGLKRVRMGFI